MNTKPTGLEIIRASGTSAAELGADGRELVAAFRYQNPFDLAAAMIAACIGSGITDPRNIITAVPAAEDTLSYGLTAVVLQKQMDVMWCKDRTGGIAFI